MRTAPKAPPSFVLPPDERIADDVAAVGRIDAIKTVLRVLMQTTRLRLAVVARVTAESWTCCAVQDDIDFGLRPGDKLEIATTFCNTVRGLGGPLVINHASEDPRFATHPAPKLYGIESYIAVPLYRRDGSFFGVLCALDPRPALLSEDTLEVFRHLGDLIGYQLEQEDALGQRDAQLFSAHEASKLREQLIGIVSHDLRSPLNTITLSSEVLLRREDLDERARQGIRRIHEAADRANRLIRDQLDFTQARMGQALPVKRQAMDLHDVAQQVVDEVTPAAAGRLLELECLGDGKGQWDPDRIAQVLTNLLTNALQYSPPRTSIRVKTHCGDTEAVLSVSNEGPPIPAHLLPNLFEPMTRGTQEAGERRSIGLGLFIVDRIARAHGGRVDVCSTEGGTSFQVHLPRGG